MAKSTYLIRHHFSGPDNISINQLTKSDLENLLIALRIAENYVPLESNIELLEKIKTFLNIHYKEIKSND